MNEVCLRDRVRVDEVMERCRLTDWGCPREVPIAIEAPNAGLWDRRLAETGGDILGDTHCREAGAARIEQTDDVAIGDEG